ncbi:DUF2764 family protein [Legionella saoudiensis]|uniref:DUF2764 family protein n=1 Tax=Legionella saoudiensis TaxID=1750561 RepID=UPI0007308743|nr:DUF2764 family protein [Legionella saoudiensis]
MSAQFYTVASSLPRLGSSFKIASPPISRFQLEKRLKLLPEKHITQIFAIELLVWRSWFMPQQSVAETRILYQQIIKNQSSFIINLIDWYFDLRSVFAAIRMRNEKKEAPENPHYYWISNWEHRLMQKWHDADFGLKSVYPWLPKVQVDMEKNNTAAIEEFLLAHIWKHLSIIEAGHYFDFEALTIYLLRWNIISYWSSFNKSQTLERIEKLCNSLIDWDHLSLK